MTNVRRIRWSVALTASLVALLGASALGHQPIRISPGMSATFFNPIVNNYADPWMTQWHHRYYLTATTGSNVTLWSASNLANVAVGQSTVVWSPQGKQSHFQDIWSPELYHFGSRWYIYFAADIGGVNQTHRDYVLESLGNNPMGRYRFVGEIHDQANQWMIDPNVLQWQGKKYLLWSGWLSPHNQVQRLFIAQMASPTKLQGPGRVISSPTYPWENSVAAINEGPVSLVHHGKAFVVYSANASWTNRYALGLLTLKGRNPMNPLDWVKRPTPVFASANGVFGPGRASFVTADQGQQWWMVYNAARYSGSGWNRTIRAQPFSWNANGTPHFGVPLPLDQAISWPKGTPKDRVNYVPHTNSKGFAVITVQVAQKGIYGLFIRYQNPNAYTTFQNFALNGKALPQLAFPETEVFSGKQNRYGVADQTLPLPAGKSTIKIFEGDGLAHIQMLQVTARPSQP